MFRRGMRIRVNRGSSFIGLIGCVITVLILICGIVVVGFMFNMLRSSDVVQQAVSRVQSHPDAVRALGEPIKAGFFVTGGINTSGDSGRAELSLPVSGPRDRGTVTVVAVKNDDGWRFTTLELVPKKYPDRIDLLAKE